MRQRPPTRPVPASLDFSMLSKIKKLDVTDLMLVSQLEQKHTPFSLGQLLEGVDRSAVRARLKKLSKLLGTVLGASPGTQIPLANQRGPGQVYEITSVGKEFVRWATEHLILFQKQISTRVSSPRIEIGSVHAMLRVAAELRERFKTVLPEVQVHLTPIHSRHILGGLNPEFGSCDCFLAPIVSNAGKLKGMPEEFEFEQLGADEIVAIVNDALMQVLGEPIGRDDIAKWLSYLPGKGIILLWIKESLGADFCERLVPTRATMKDAINQMQVLRYQSEPGLMLVSKTFAQFAVADDPLTYAHRLDVTGSLHCRELAKELTQTQILTGLLYKSPELNRSTPLKTLKQEVQKLRNQDRVRSLSSPE